MAESNYVDSLTPTELIIFLRHLELGEAHLRHMLSDREFDQLMSLERLDNPVKNKLEIDKPEITGNIILVMNSIFTATLGLWMGLSAFLDISLHSYIKFILIVSFAALVGTVVGYLNYKYTKKQVKRVLNRRKIQSFQMSILDKLISERIREINKKTEELNCFLKELQIKKSDEVFSFKFESEKETLEWVKKLDFLVETNWAFYKDRQVYEVFAKEIDETKKELRESLKFYEEKEEIEESSKTEQKKDGYFPFMKKLTSQNLEEKIPRPSWIMSNLTSIFISSIPMLFGGFSSTFVYFSGVPQVAQEFGKSEIATLLVNPETKKIELIIALCITAYFAFNFLYLNYKSFIRSRDFEEMEEILIRKKNSDRKNGDKLLKIKEARSHMMKLCIIFKDLKLLAAKKD